MKLKRFNGAILIALIFLSSVIQVYAGLDTDRPTSNTDDLMGTAYPGGTYWGDALAITLAQNDQNVYSGILFPDWNITQGAFINSANLTVYYYNNLDYGTSDVTVLVQGFKQYPGSLNWNNLVDSPYTSAYTSYNLSQWISEGYFNISVTSIVQEIVKRSDYTQGDGIGFRILHLAPSGPGADPTFYRYDIGANHDPLDSLRPTLAIDYEDSYYYKGWIIEAAPEDQKNILTIRVNSTNASIIRMESINYGQYGFTLNERYDHVMDRSLSVMVSSYLDKDWWGIGNGWVYFLIRDTGGIELWKTNDLGENIYFVSDIGGGTTTSVDLEITSNYIYVATWISDDSHTITLKRFGLLNESLIDSTALFGVQNNDKFSFDMDSYENETGTYMAFCAMTQTGAYNTIMYFERYPDMTESAMYQAGNYAILRYYVNVECSDDGGIMFFNGWTLGDAQFWKTTYKTFNDPYNDWVAQVDQNYCTNYGDLSPNFGYQNDKFWFVSMKTGAPTNVIQTSFSVYPFTSWTQNSTTGLTGSQIYAGNGAVGPYVMISPYDDCYAIDWETLYSQGSPYATEIYVDIDPPFSEQMGSIYVEDLYDGLPWILTPPSGVDPQSLTCIESYLEGNDDPTLEEVQEAIDLCEQWIIPPDPGEDPDPGSWSTSLKSFKLYFLAIGVSMIVIPWILFALTRDLEYIAWIIFLNAMGAGLLIEFMRL